MGPDSLASVDIVPVRAARKSTQKLPESAKTTPTMPIAARSVAYMRRRPKRSPSAPTVSETMAMPASIAVNTAPTCRSLRPLRARAVPRITVPKP